LFQVAEEEHRVRVAVDVAPVHRHLADLAGGTTLPSSSITATRCSG